MKVKVNIRDYLAAQCGHEIRMDVPVDVPVCLDIDDLLDDNGIPDEDEFDFDLDEALAEGRQVAHLWGVADVQGLRPDLNDDQAWQVLQAAANRAIRWDALETVAYELFGPRPGRRWHGRIDVTLTDSDGDGRGEVINRLRDLADQLAKGKPDVKATADEGSVRLADTGETAKASEAV